MQKTERFEMRLEPKTAELMAKIASDTGYTKSEIVRLALSTLATQLDAEALRGVRYGPKWQE